MNTKPISPRDHTLADYALTGVLLIAPQLLGFGKKIKTLYAIEAAVLLPYVALTESPVAVRSLIRFTTHGKIDPFNIAQFALQSFWKPFRKNKTALLFNIGFTVVSAATVLLNDWNGPTKRQPAGGL